MQVSWYRYTSILVMKELQEHIAKANHIIRHTDTEISVPLGREWVFYEVSEFGIIRSTGRVAELSSDYQKREGIGEVVPPITELPEVLAGTQEAASKIIAIQEKHVDTIRDMSVLCAHHVRNPYVHIPSSHRGQQPGGIFRIQICAASSVFQILFPGRYEKYAVGYQWDLSTVVEGWAFNQQPFSQIPPEFMIPDNQSSGNFVPATFENMFRMTESTPLNTRSKQSPYQSRSAKVFERFKGMAEELLAS